jgi:zinc-binding alcohol dehydrogenase/oxidoreductase
VQAIVLREHGEPSVLGASEHPDPVPGPGEAVVELKAAALNRRDTAVRRGAYGDYPLPFVLGSDGAGIRRDTGEEVVILPSLAWGDREEAPGPDFRILGGPDDGTYAELIAVPTANLCPKPRRLSWHEAAAFPLAGLTAYRALFCRARARYGETVLVLGVGSGVSTFAISLAYRAGCRVLVTSSSDEKLAAARELGAEGGVNYARGDWVAGVRELAGAAGIDVVVDSVGTTWPDSVRCVRPGGRVVVFGATGGSAVELQIRPVYLGQVSILGTTMGSPRDFAGLLRALEPEGVHPVVDSVRPLAEAADAHERLESGAHFGKLVLDIA